MTKIDGASDVPSEADGAGAVLTSVALSERSFLPLAFFDEECEDGTQWTHRVQTGGAEVRAKTLYYDKTLDSQEWREVVVTAYDAGEKAYSIRFLHNNQVYEAALCLGSGLVHVFLS